MSTLVVPIDVRALVVSAEDASRTHAFARLRYGFDELGAHQAYLAESITPQPFADAAPGELPAGVHLHWAIPAALSRVSVDPGTIDLAPPNRWLVVRIGATATAETKLAAWVVESDYLWDTDTDDRNALCRAVPVHAPAGAPTQVTRKLGRVTRLADFPGPPPAFTADHTVLGFGIPTFAAAYPHAPNVFGMWDALDDAAAGQDGMPPPSRRAGTANAAYHPVPRRPAR